MNSNQQDTILVLDGTGKTGRRVAERLTERDLPVRVGSRSGEPRFDWDDSSTWAPALEGVGSAYLSHRLDAIPGSAETLGRSPSWPLSAVCHGWCCSPGAASPRPSEPSRPFVTREPS